MTCHQIVTIPKNIEQQTATFGAQPESSEAFVLQGESPIAIEFTGFVETKTGRALGPLRLLHPKDFQRLSLNCHYPKNANVLLLTNCGDVLMFHSFEYTVYALIDEVAYEGIYGRNSSFSHTNTFRRCSIGGSKPARHLLGHDTDTQLVHPGRVRSVRYANGTKSRHGYHREQPVRLPAQLSVHLGTRRSRAVICREQR